MKWTRPKKIAAAGLGVVTAPLWAPVYPVYAAVKQPAKAAKMFYDGYDREGQWENPITVKEFAQFTLSSAVRDGRKAAQWVSS